MTQELSGTQTMHYAGQDKGFSATAAGDVMQEQLNRLEALSDFAPDEPMARLEDRLAMLRDAAIKARPLLARAVSPAPGPVASGAAQARAAARTLAALQDLIVCTDLPRPTITAARDRLDAIWELCSDIRNGIIDVEEARTRA